MVTAETAMAAPFVVAVVIAALWVSSLGVAQARANDAARESARLVARGEPPSAAAAAAEESAVEGSRVDITMQHGQVRVQVRTPARLPLFGGIGVSVSGIAVARVE